jgi:hypothetical protein
MNYLRITYAFACYAYIKTAYFILFTPFSAAPPAAARIQRQGVLQFPGSSHPAFFFITRGSLIYSGIRD